MRIEPDCGSKTRWSSASAVDFPARVVADQNGIAILEVHVKNPARPRQYIDGQVYGIRPILEETLAYGANYPFNPWDFVSLLIWDNFQPDSPITWYGSLQPIFQQYANLYPIMERFLDLADYDSVCDHRAMLQLAFGLSIENPNSMPVTRDLSTAKRAAILEWLEFNGPDGKPLKGTPVAGQPAALGLSAEADSREPDLSRKGGKAAAAARRIGSRRN